MNERMTEIPKALRFEGGREGGKELSKKERK
jgi:hypothetical protein